MTTLEETSLQLVCPYDKSAVTFEDFPETRTSLATFVDRVSGTAQGVALDGRDIELLRDWCNLVLARREKA